MKPEIRRSKDKMMVLNALHDCYYSWDMAMDIFDEYEARICRLEKIVRDVTPHLYAEYEKTIQRDGQFKHSEI